MQPVALRRFDSKNNQSVRWCGLLAAGVFWRVWLSGGSRTPLKTQPTSQEPLESAFLCLVETTPGRALALKTTPWLHLKLPCPASEPGKAACLSRSETSALARRKATRLSGLSETWLASWRWS